MRSELDSLQQEGLQALFYQHPEVTYVADTNGNLMSYNERFVDLTGFSPDEPGKVAFTSFVHPEDSAVAAAEFANAVTGQNRSYRCRFVSRTGDFVSLAVIHIPVRNLAGAVVAVFGIARDLDGFLHAELAKRRGEAQLQSTLDQMSIGISFLDRQWRITFVNAKARYYLRGATDIVGKSFWELFPHLKDTDFGATCLRAMEQGEVATTRAFSPVFKRWLEVTAHPTAGGLAIHTLDVTDDQDARTQLEENARHLRRQAALLDAARDAIYLRDLDGRITYWNKSAEQLFGWSNAEISGRVGREVLPVDAEAFDRATDEVIRLGHWTGQLEKYARDGRVVTVDCRWQLIRDEAGEPESIFAVDSDITAWLRGEEKRNRAQRLESLGTLASGIAHDLNNILTPILMSARYCQQASRIPTD